MDFTGFKYSSIDEVYDECKAFNLGLHFSKDLSVLKREVKIGNVTILNSLANHPMEGCDGNIDGSPGELTIRRYERIAEGGAGLIWFEAVAVVPEGKAAPRQLFINENNVDSYKKLHEMMIQKAQAAYGSGFTPITIMQLTHSGRFSKPEGKPAPIIACNNPYLDPICKVDKDTKIITDDELERLEEAFVKAAVLAKEAGFGGVDVKCCHRYLNSELLSAFTRKGKYGETFEGRTRFLLNVVDRIKARLGSEFIVTTRMNIYDGISYPYGWGVDKEDYLKLDLSEPIRLVRLLYDKGVGIINLTMGTPYYNPHVNRPYDKGPYVPQEHQLAGVARLLSGAAEIQRAVPEMAVVGTGYSWLREFSQYLAAGVIESGAARLVGFGREVFAYPEFARDILYNDGMEKGKCCIACGKCTEIMRAGGTAGCVIKDSSVYAPIYKTFCR